jgi:hypothetical protein
VTILILKPGQIIHINKGRLHCFRKLSSEILDETDAHVDLRQDLIKETKELGPWCDKLCLSIAWDWVFHGVSEIGVKTEVAHVLSRTRENQKSRRRSLAQPELSLLRMAMFSAVSTSVRSKDSVYMPLPGDLCRGLLAGGLVEVVKAHLAILENATKEKKEIMMLASASAAKDGKYASIDPYGNDFVCQCCSAELSNILYQCDKCFTLLSTEYNLCHGCYSDEVHLRLEERSHLSTRDEPCSSVNHFIGEKEKCCCKSKWASCLECKKCPWCICGCHQKFTLCCRFFDEQDYRSLLKKVEDVAFGNKERHGRTANDVPKISVSFAPR